jgi:hypothetical protein
MPIYNIVGVAIITSVKVTCVLLMDASDGIDLPKILAREILDAFVSVATTSPIPHPPSPPFLS